MRDCRRLRRTARRAMPDTAGREPDRARRSYRRAFPTGKLRCWTDSGRGTCHVSESASRRQGMNRFQDAFEGQDCSVPAVRTAGGSRTPERKPKKARLSSVFSTGLRLPARRRMRILPAGLFPDAQNATGMRSKVPECRHAT